MGVASMRVGELSVLQCAPQYAYGEKGIPPTIPPAATLQFEVELLSLQQPKQEARTFADDNPEPPRTPAEIEQAYARRMATKEVPKSGLDGALDWIKNIYIIGLFRGEKGVRARTQRALRGEGRSVSLMRGPLDRRRAAAVVPQPADHIPVDLCRRRRRFLSRDLARRGASRRGCARWRRSERHPRRRDPMIRRSASRGQLSGASGRRGIIQVYHQYIINVPRSCRGPICAARWRWASQVALSAPRRRGYVAAAFSSSRLPRHRLAIACSHFSRAPGGGPARLPELARSQTHDCGGMINAEAG